jgi:hypothetical protein
MYGGEKTTEKKMEKVEDTKSRREHKGEVAFPLLKRWQIAEEG